MAYWRVFAPDGAAPTGDSVRPAVSQRTDYLILFGVIALGLAFRLYAFNGGILDHHFLRQVDTAALARNFAEEGMNIFYPRVDWRGASTGYVEAEFQLYTYLVACLYRLFGEHVELARALNLVFYVLTAFVFFGLVRRLYDVRVALLSVFFYAVMPITAYFAHSVQPDTMMLLGALSGLYFFLRWCDHGRWGDLAVSALGLGVALAVKPLNLYLGIPLLYLCVERFGWKLILKPQLWIYGAAVLIPPVVWYMHAYSLWVEHGNTLFRAYSNIDFAWLHTKDYPYPVISLGGSSYVSDLASRAIYMIATPGALLFLVLGAGVIVRQRNYFLLSWFAAFLATMAVFAFQHRAHDYYQMPLAIIAAIAMALGCVQLLQAGARAPRIVTLLVLAGYVATGLLWSWSYQSEGAMPQVWLAFFIAGAVLLAAYAAFPPPNRALIGASLALTAAFGACQTASLTNIREMNVPRIPFSAKLAELTPPDARIVIAHNWHRKNWFQHRTAQGEILSYDPVEFYLSHRRGWSVSGDQVPPAFVETLRLRGATHFASMCCVWSDESAMSAYPALRDYLYCAYTPLDVTETWVIFRLDAPRRRADGSSCLSPPTRPAVAGAAKGIEAAPNAG